MMKENGGLYVLVNGMHQMHKLPADKGEKENLSIATKQRALIDVAKM